MQIVATATRSVLGFSPHVLQADSDGDEADDGADENVCDREDGE